MTIEQAAKELAFATRVAVLTGAGISAESGVPTFRSKDGLWDKFRPEQLANVEAFLDDPQLVWQWYDSRRDLVAEARPNAGHFTLAEMEKAFERFSIATQNVDGLHRRAGSENVIELHGNIMRDRCLRCGKVADEPLKNRMRRCRCGGLLRPDVVWFGEMLPADALEQAFDDASKADVYFSIGTAAVVYPAAQLPVEALNKGAFVIEINIDETPLTASVHAHIRGEAGTVLPRLWQKAESYLKKI